MSVSIAELNHGSIQEVLYYLECDTLTPAELQAALVNAFRLLQALYKDLNE